MIVISYGGGIQSVAMCILSARGIIPRADRIVAADTGREVQSTWDFLENHMRPWLEPFGMTVDVAPHSLATVDVYAKNGDMLIPAFTETGKLPTFCSNEWKQRVVQRFLRSEGINSATISIGFSMDETRRLPKVPESGPWIRSYPLIDAMISRTDCALAIASAGLPLPRKSRCFMCPHQSTAEWIELRDLSPVEFAKAVDLDAEIREADERGSIYLHQSRKPLSDVDFDQERESPETLQQCSLGSCFI